MYKAPVGDIVHTIVNVTGMGRDLDEGTFGDFSADLLQAILEEAGRLAGDEIEPVAVAAEKNRREICRWQGDHASRVESGLAELC